MGHRAHIEVRNDIQVITFPEGLESEDAIDLLKCIRDGHVEYHPNRLWDMRDTPLEMTEEDFKRIADLSREISRQATRVVILADSDFSVGVNRIYEIFRGADQTQVRFFRDADEAFDWFREG